MGRIARLLFVLALVVVPVVVGVTSQALPARVASHFGPGGMANGWMSHEGYVRFMLALTILVPLCVVASAALVPRLTSSLRGVRNPQYWMAPERREETLGWLASHACALGTIVAALLLAVHLLTVEANARTPAQLSESALFSVVGVFVVLLAVWALALALRFRMPR